MFEKIFKPNEYKSILKVVMKMFSENGTVLDYHSVGKMKARLEKDPDFIRFEFVHEGDDADIIKKILFTDHEVIAVKVRRSSKKRISEGYYEYDGYRRAWRQEITVYSTVLMRAGDEIFEREFVTKCSYKSDMERSALEAAYEFLRLERLYAETNRR